MHTCGATIPLLVNYDLCIVMEIASAIERKERVRLKKMHHSQNMTTTGSAENILVLAKWTCLTCTYHRPQTPHKIK